MARPETGPRIKDLPDPDLWLTVAIEKWRWEYGLGLSSLEVQDPLHEDKVIRILGTTTLRRALLNVDLRVAPGSGLNEEFRRKKNWDNVGTISRIKGGFEGFVGISETALPMVITMLSAGQYRSLEMSLVKGDRLNYPVQSYHFKQREAEDMKAFETANTLW